MSVADSIKAGKRVFTNFYIFLSVSLAIICCNLTTECSAIGACDKSRKVFKDVTFGVISHGVNANYTQVSFRASDELELIMDVIIRRTPTASGWSRLKTQVNSSR